MFCGDKVVNGKIQGGTLSLNLQWKIVGVQAEIISFYLTSLYSEEENPFGYTIHN